MEQEKGTTGLSANETGLRRKHKKRLAVPVQDTLEVPTAPNYTWSADFMIDALSDGRKIRVLNVTDDYNREALGIEVGLSFPAERAIRDLSNWKSSMGCHKTYVWTMGQNLLP